MLFDRQQIWKKSKSVWLWIGDNSPQLLFFSAVIGFIFLVCEVNQLSKQSEILEETLSNTIKPLCVVAFRDTSQTIMGDMCEEPDERLSTIKKNGITIYNKGNGIVSLVGVFTYLCMDSGKSLNIRELILSKDVDTTKIGFDEQQRIARNRTIPIGDSLNININWGNIKFRPGPWYLISTIVLYKDTINNLYDTIHVRSTRFTEELPNEPKPIEIEINFSETFHMYNDKEKTILKNIFSKMDHNLKDFIY